MRCVKLETGLYADLGRSTWVERLGPSVCLFATHLSDSIFYLCVFKCRFIIIIIIIIKLVFKYFTSVGLAKDPEG